MERVKTRLLLLVGLERVARLQIGVLHDPAGPEGEEVQEKQLWIKTTRKHSLSILSLKQSTNENGLQFF